MRFMSSNLELGPLENLSAKCGGHERAVQAASGILTARRNRHPSTDSQDGGRVKVCQPTIHPQ